MLTNIKILAVIPARSGSKRIVKKTQSYGKIKTITQREIKTFI